MILRTKRSYFLENQAWVKLSGGGHIYLNSDMLNILYHVQYYTKPLNPLTYCDEFAKMTQKVRLSKGSHCRLSLFLPGDIASCR